MPKADVGAAVGGAGGEPVPVNPAPPDSPFCLGFVLDSLKYVPCGEACCTGTSTPSRSSALASQPQLSPSEFHHHLVTWEGLSVYLNEGLLTDILLPEAVAALQFPKVKAMTSPSDTSTAVNWTGLDLDKVNVLLAPCSGKLSLSFQEGRVTSATCPPALQLSAHVERFQIGVQERQIKKLRVFYAQFVLSKLLQRYKSIPRPNVAIADSIPMWKQRYVGCGVPCVCVSVALLTITVCSYAAGVLQHSVSSKT